MCPIKIPFKYKHLKKKTVFVIKKKGKHKQNYLIRCLL